MAKDDLELVARSMFAVTAPMPGSRDDAAYPVLGIDTDFDALPADQGEATVDDTMTREIVLRLAAAAVRALRLPTIDMTSAGAAVLAADRPPTAADREQAFAVFRAMIETVLG